MSIEADTNSVYGPISPGSLVGFATERHEDPRDKKTFRAWEREMIDYQRHLRVLTGLTGVSSEEFEHMPIQEINDRIAQLGPPEEESGLISA